MMKKRFLPLFLLTLLTISCQKTLLVFERYEKEGTFINPKEVINEDNHYRHDTYDPVDAYINHESGVITSYSDVYSYGINRLMAPINGNPHALVIPINFLDSDKKDNYKQKIIIENAFFGKEEKNQYESLTSYYYKSSYGQLYIDGFVTDFLDINISSSDIRSGRITPSYVTGKALEWYYNSFTGDKSYFDINNDDFIDYLFIVYNYPKDESFVNVSSFWAYCDHMDKNPTYNNIAPYINGFIWMSYDFFDTKNDVPNSHVLIHEAGHLMGLDDYYNTSSDAYYQPLGYCDMMDRNLGDHTALSKMLLNWITPIVITNPGQLTLKPFPTSGEVYLIPSKNGYNNSQFDEYLLLEYFTPEGLNKGEGENRYVYKDKNGKTGVFSYFSKAGLKVYHVNAKLGYYASHLNHSLICEINDPNSEELLSSHSSYVISLMNSNSIFDSEVNTRSVLYHLLESSGNNTFINGVPANNNTLFHAGDDFGINKFNAFTFSDNGVPAFDFEIESLTKDGITISFTNND